MIKTDEKSPVTIAAEEINQGALKIYNEEQWKELQKSIKDIQ